MNCLAWTEEGEAFQEIAYAKEYSEQKLGKQLSSHCVVTPLHVPFHPEVIIFLNSTFSILCFLFYGVLFDI